MSNWFTDDQIKELKNLNILKYFKHVYGWDNTYAKPNPCSINQKILKQYNRNEVIIIGNSLEIDIKCAENANIDSIWFNQNNEINVTNINPTYEINNLLQIKDII